MNSRMPVVVDGVDDDVIDLSDPKWGGGVEDDPPEMDEAWCRRRLWEITKLLREQVTRGPNASVIAALREEADIVKVLMAKVVPNAKPADVRKKRVEELPDDELEETVERLKAEGKL